MLSYSCPQWMLFATTRKLNHYFKSLQFEFMIHKFYNDGLQLEYYDISTASRSQSTTQKLFIPGLCSAASEVAEPIIPVFEGEGYVLSLRGRGGSMSPDKSQYTLSHQASDVVAIARHLKLKECVLIGHSVGASIAIRAAKSLSDILVGLVILDFPPFYPPIDKSWVSLMLKTTHVGISEQALYGLAHCGKYEDLFEELKSITAKVCIVFANGSDSAIPPENIDVLKRNLPNAKFTSIDSGHEVFLQNPVGVIDAIEAVWNI